jgi:hypothetical protein
MNRTFFIASSTALASFAFVSSASAFCPCYTASSSNNNNNCAIEAVQGINPSIPEWNDIFDLVSQGPAVWGNKGPSVGDIGQGCGKPEAYHTVPARFPCELLKGIAKVETGWRQFCVPDLPSDQVGGPSRTIISFDCGYGIGQVTSGMHVGENPSFNRNLVASDPTYNLATGTRILASKWIATNCVGDNQPTVVEHWYVAAWAYNGLAYVNNPNNPNYGANRGVWNPQVGGGAPYQEKVFGFMEYPERAMGCGSPCLSQSRRYWGRFESPRFARTELFIAHELHDQATNSHHAMFTIHGFVEFIQFVQFERHWWNGWNGWNGRNGRQRRCRRRFKWRNGRIQRLRFVRRNER